MGVRLRITDHVVLRYLERVWGVDVAAARREIRRSLRVAETSPDELPAPTAVLSHGVRFMISGTAATTCMPQHEPDRRTGGKRERRDV